MSTTNRKPPKDLVGYKWGRLTVAEYTGIKAHNKHYWLCRCDCGGVTELNTSRITGATPTLSCGCLRKEKLLENRADPTKHGLHKSKLYAIFYGMHYRCNNKNAQRWPYYGGKGVKVCDEWSEFLSFYHWATSNGYKEGLSIDRIDSDGNYEPSNCQWITLAENTRKSNVKRNR